MTTLGFTVMSIEFLDTESEDFLDNTAAAGKTPKSMESAAADSTKPE